MNSVFTSCSDDLAAFDQTSHLTFDLESTLAFSWAVIWQGIFGAFKGQGVVGGLLPLSSALFWESPPFLVSLKLNSPQPFLRYRKCSSAALFIRNPSSCPRHQCSADVWLLVGREPEAWKLAPGGNHDACNPGNYSFRLHSIVLDGLTLKTTMPLLCPCLSCPSAFDSAVHRICSELQRQC